MKRNKEFDRSIREKLENLAPGFNADSWDKLENRLDSEDAQSEWDAQLSQRLRQIERPYNRASWQALAERLDLEEKRLNGIYSAKAKELLFMALLLWSVTRFLTFPPESPEQAYRQTPVTPSPTVLYNTNTSNTDTDQRACSAASSDLQASAFADEAAAKAQSVPSGQEEFFSTVTESASGLPLLSTFATTPLLNGVQGIAANPATAFVAAPDLPQVLPPSFKVLEAPASVHHFVEEGVASPEFFLPNALLAEANPIAPTGMPGLLPERGLPLEKTLQQHPLPRKRFVRIGMMGASDYNRIITPPVRVNGEIVSLDRYAIGYSGGITLGFESGRWEVETGFIYTAKRYYPLQVLYVEGSLKDGIIGSGIKQTEFDIMQVPLNFRYNFLSRDRWRIYGLVGASLHIVAQANYYIADLEDYQSATFRPEPTDGGRDGQERPEVFEAQTLRQGWLEGGSLLDNSYAGINIGAGIERYMSPRWSLFAQPTYYHSLFYPNKGLGPVNDRIHTMSLFMGVKVRM